MTAEKIAINQNYSRFFQGLLFISVVVIAVYFTIVCRMQPTHETALLPAIQPLIRVVSALPDTKPELKPSYNVDKITQNDQLSLSDFNNVFSLNYSYLIDEESEMSDLELIQKKRMEHLKHFCRYWKFSYKQDKQLSISLFTGHSCYECRVPKTGDKIITTRVEGSAAVSGNFYKKSSECAEIE